jgi:polysaccharide deacetylase family protein (PEP-CTERM system associated)
MVNILDAPTNRADERAKDSAIHRDSSLNKRTQMPPLNAFTVDVEDYYHVSAFERTIDRKRWGEYASRVADNTRRLLDLLDRHQTKATFFVLGWVARQHPALVREIHHRGHEIGSHSYWHRLIYSQTAAEFRQDLRDSRAALEDAIGTSVHAYRAPSFSITRHSLWALEILVEEGFQRDSSVFPIHHDRYGIPKASPKIHQIVTPAGAIWEFPMSVVRFAKMNVPVGGGGYFRLYPLPWTLHILSRINQVHGRSFVCYVHPWEIDPQQPRIRAGSWISRARHYVNLSSTERKLDRLLSTFRFGRLCDVVQDTMSRGGDVSAGYRELVTTAVQ